MGLDLHLINKIWYKIDERLEELVAEHNEWYGGLPPEAQTGTELEEIAPALAQALLRVRQALDEIAWPLKSEASCSGVITLPKTREELIEVASAALADTELEKALGGSK